MTGYGKAAGVADQKKVTVEIKTLNSKQFDLILRIPAIYKEKELEIRSMLNQILDRGKVEVTITIEGLATDNNYTINRELAVKYFNEITRLQQVLNYTESAPILPSILKMPDVIQMVPLLLEEKEWLDVLEIFREAVSLCDQSRTAEGGHLEKDFIVRIGVINNLLKEVEKYEDQRIQRIRMKMKTDLEKYIDDRPVDENRLEQEIVYYIEKLDITEEKVRLNNHCEYFLQTLAESDRSNGKKLNFISQEIGREINTIGSKANDADIQKLVVQMKDELEKIKEQLFNIL
jgi:uncharacterized protein (TIGR00255 family)